MILMMQAVLMKVMLISSLRTKKPSSTVYTLHICIYSSFSKSLADMSLSKPANHQIQEISTDQDVSVIITQFFNIRAYKNC